MKYYMIWFFNFISRWTVMIPGNKILLFFHPKKKVTFFHWIILKPISDVKFVNIANLSITNFCGIWKFLILSSLKVYFKCLFRRSWGSEIKSNYKFNGNKFALFHSYLVFTRRPPPPAGSWKQVTRKIKRYFIAIEYIVIFGRPVVFINWGKLKKNQGNWIIGLEMASILMTRGRKRPPRYP